MKNIENNSPIVITKHAFKRAKERLSFTASACRKMAVKAYQQGVSLIETSDFLLKQSAKTIEYGMQNIRHARLYGEIVYLFIDNILVTVYPMSSMLKKLARVYKHSV